MYTRPGLVDEVRRPSTLLQEHEVLGMLEEWYSTNLKRAGSTGGTESVHEFWMNRFAKLGSPLELSWAELEQSISCG